MCTIIPFYLWRKCRNLWLFGLVQGRRSERFPQQPRRLHECKRVHPPAAAHLFNIDLGMKSWGFDY